jgi:pathogenesis-related protein 1
MFVGGWAKSISVRFVRDAIAALLLGICVLSFTSRAEAQTIPAEGASGAHQDADKCPGASYLVGFVVRSGGWLNQIAIICSPVDATGKTGAPNFGPLRGGNGGAPPHNTTCLVNEVAVGVILHFMPDKRRVRGIELDCKNAQFMQSQGFGRLVGLGQTAPPGDSLLCNPGNAVIRVDIHWGDDINAVGVACGPGPKIAAANTTPPPPACAPNNGDPVPQAWADMLNAHNARRKLHCECPLSWSASLASDSQTYASKCALGVHGINGGENLADFVSVNVSAAGVVVPVLPAESNTAAYENSWYCEIANYLFSNPVFVGGFTQDCGKGNNLKVNGHFTQVMWKDTSQVGCGMQTCPMTVDQVKDGAGNVTATNVHSQGTHWVCRYKAPGNAPVDAATLTKEVLPPNCH